MRSVVWRVPRSFALIVLVLVLLLLLGACGGSSAQTDASQSMVQRYVGAVSHSLALIGVVADQQTGKLAVYVCDSKTIGEWFTGHLQSDGHFALTNEAGARVEGQVTDTQVQGTFTPAGRQALAYTSQPATGQEGIYRVDQTVNSIHYTGGWVLGPNGEITGVIRRNGIPTDASHLNPTHGKVTLSDGTTLTPQFISNEIGL